MTAADVRAEVARVYSASGVRLVGLTEDRDLYARGSAWMFVPALFSDFAPVLMQAVLVRRISLLAGRCPVCDEVVATDAQIAHGPDCSGSDLRAEAIRAAFPPPADPGDRLIDPEPTSPILAGRRLARIGGGWFYLHS